MTSIEDRIKDLRNAEKSLAEDTSSRQKDIQTAKHNLIGILNENYRNTVSLFNQFIESGENLEEAGEILKYIYGKFKQTPERVWVPKSYFPKELEGKKVVEWDFLTNEEEFKEFVKYTKRNLKNSDEIIRGIEFSDGVVKGNRYKFALCYDKFLREVVKDGRRVLTAGQLENEDILKAIKGKYYVCDGFNLTGTKDVNSEEAKYVLKQFQKRGIGEVDEKTDYLKSQIRFDLRDLDLDKKTNFVKITDKTIFTETKNLIGENYNFKIRDKFGIPIRDEEGNRESYIPKTENNSGLFGCGLGGDLDSNVRNENLGISYPDGRVVVGKVA